MPDRPAGGPAFQFGEQNMRILILMVLAMLATFRPAMAQEATEGQTRTLQLADAYQDGFLRMSAVSCFSVYSSSGFVFGDFINGVIDGETAINSLEQVALLHSVAYTSVTEVLELTPEDDSLAREEISSIREILERENRLLSALVDLFSEGSTEQLEQVKYELQLVEQALDVYTSEPAE